MTKQTQTIKRVTDLINNNDIKQWKPQTPITISAGTGVGKSHFIKNSLYDYAKQHGKKILMLIHRSNCVDQFRKELEREHKTNIITVASYQRIDTIESSNLNSFNFSCYDYIVCDEFHYFISDALFNDNTYLSFNAIMNQENTIKIFMSATGEDMLNYINNVRQIKTIDYSIPLNYDFIGGLYFYNNDIWLNKILSHSKKAIVFMQSAEKAFEYYNQYKEISIYNCSKGNALYKYVEPTIINNILIQERFEKNYLFTTSAMDSGVNIIDDELTTIIIDGLIDINVIKQCIGRKRIINNEKINVYIRNMSHHRLGGIQLSLNKTVLDKKIDTFTYYKSVIDNDAIENIKNISFYKYISNALDREYEFIDLEKHELICYLESICNNWLDKKSQTELVNFVSYRKDGKLKTSRNSLNDYFHANDIGYQLSQKRMTRNNIKNTYWILERIKSDSNIL